MQGSADGIHRPAASLHGCQPARLPYALLPGHPLSSTSVHIHLWILVRSLSCPCACPALPCPALPCPALPRPALPCSARPPARLPVCLLACLSVVCLCSCLPACLPVHIPACLHLHLHLTCICLITSMWSTLPTDNTVLCKLAHQSDECFVACLNMQTGCTNL